MIINTENLEIETVAQIREATGIPLPRQPQADTLGQLNPPRAYVAESDPPVGDVVEPAGYEQVNGEWRQAWTVRDFTDQERADRLSGALAQAMQRINDGYDAAAKALVESYPEMETKTFDKQDGEARAWLADNTAATPFLDGLLETRAISKSELVNLIIQKSDTFALASGRLTGRRQTLETQAQSLHDSGDLSGLQALGWSLSA